MAQGTEISRLPGGDAGATAALRRLEDTGGGQLLMSDLRVALLLLNEARYRTIQRLFGVSRDQVNLTTAVAALVLAGAVQERATRALNAPGAPSASDVALGAGVLRELVYGAAGPWSRDTPFFGTLVTIAVLGGLARPAVGASLRSVMSSTRRMRLGFDNRYGQLIARNRRR